jgi:Na+-transporting NADH:ubiquinone oxidoreductase subunit NqrB
VCSAAAVVALAALALYGLPRAGLALAFGLALGGLNGLLAARSADSAESFRLLSLMRIGVLSTIALAVGLLLAPDVVWLTIAGVASSQFVMVALAARSVMTR